MHQRRAQLLLVDGDINRAERLARRLAGSDLCVHFAENGAQALLKAHELLPDVVVTAAEVPLLDGYRLLDALRKQPPVPHLPVILITEGNTPDEIARGWKAGADLCVPRTMGEPDLLATLHRALSTLLSDAARNREQTRTARPLAAPAASAIV